MVNLLVVGCVLKDARTANKQTKWQNVYRGDPQIAGVIVSQYPEGIEPHAPYKDKHPASIWYVFWTGDVRAFEFEPNGSVLTDSWWDKFMDIGNPIWDEVDFTYGSDPTFSKHADPRKSIRREPEVPLRKK